MSLLEVDGLSIRYRGRAAVESLSFAVAPGESVGLVGESGSGKTQTAHALLGLLRRDAEVSGSIRLGGTEIVGASERQMNRLRATRISIVFQDPMQALNPYVRVGAQLERILAAHRLASGREARRRAVAMLGRVGLADPERQYRAWPHQLSGGMRQRVMIASALIADPALLVADEPTTALDVTVQAQVLELLETLRDDTALLLITHDLGIVAGHCERLIVLEQGRLVETGRTAEVFARPEDGRTAALIDAVPRLDRGGVRLPVAGEAVLAARELTVTYALGRRSRLTAVAGVDFSVRRGETLAIVGESGSGKSTLARAALGLVPPEAGSVSLAGRVLASDLAGRSRAERRELALVFQDPAGSLDPKMRVADIVAEPLTVHEPGLDADQRRRRAGSLLEDLGLGEDRLERHPHALSGGEAQRVAIARALVTAPAVLFCDEAVAALDSRKRRSTLALLAGKQAETGLAIVFISHDLAVVREIAHRVLVMYLGKVVEAAGARELFSRPLHPYTRALLDAVPLPDPAAPKRRPPLSGEAPSPLSPPEGCAFHPRCPFAEQRCREAVPVLRDLGGTGVACHRAEELDLSG